MDFRGHKCHRKGLLLQTKPSSSLPMPISPALGLTKPYVLLPHRDRVIEAAFCLLIFPVAPFSYPRPLRPLDMLTPPYHQEKQSKQFCIITEQPDLAPLLRVYSPRMPMTLTANALYTGRTQTWMITPDLKRNVRRACPKGPQPCEAYRPPPYPWYPLIPLYRTSPPSFRPESRTVVARPHQRQSPRMFHFQERPLTLRILRIRNLRLLNLIVFLGSSMLRR